MPQEPVCELRDCRPAGEGWACGGAPGSCNLAYEVCRNLPYVLPETGEPVSGQDQFEPPPAAGDAWRSCRPAPKGWACGGARGYCNLAYEACRNLPYPLPEATDSVEEGAGEGPSFPPAGSACKSCRPAPEGWTCGGVEGYCNLAYKACRDLPYLESAPGNRPAADENNTGGSAAILELEGASAMCTPSPR